MIGNIHLFKWCKKIFTNISTMSMYLWIEYDLLKWQNQFFHNSRQTRRRYQNEYQDSKENVNWHVTLLYAWIQARKKVGYQTCKPLKMKKKIIYFFYQKYICEKQPWQSYDHKYFSYLQCKKSKSHKSYPGMNRIKM